MRRQGGVLRTSVISILVPASGCSAWNYHPPPGGPLSSHRTQRCASGYYITSRRNQEHTPRLCYGFFLHSLTLITVWIREGLGGWNLFPTNKKWAGKKERNARGKERPLHVGRGPQGSAQFRFLLFFDMPQRDGHRYWIERSLINLAEELDFRGTQFHYKDYLFKKYIYNKMFLLKSQHLWKLLAYS